MTNWEKAVESSRVLGYDSVKECLEDFYLVRRYSGTKLGDTLGVSGWLIYRLLHCYGIRTRTMSESHLGHTTSVESRKKMRLARLGRKHSTETRAKIGRLQIGHEVSAKTREKLRLFRLGSSLSEETKKRISFGLARPEVKERIRNARLNQVFPVRDTKPERLFFSRLMKEQRKRLATLGYFIIKHPNLGFCQPDFALFSKDKPSIFIFIDGCYWHCCPKHFPIAKFETQKRTLYYDRKNESIFKLYGIPFIRFWEHDLNTKFNRHYSVSTLIKTLEGIQIAYFLQC